MCVYSCVCADWNCVDRYVLIGAVFAKHLLLMMYQLLCAGSNTNKQNHTQPQHRSCSGMLRRASPSASVTTRPPSSSSLSTRQPTRTRAWTGEQSFHSIFWLCFIVLSHFIMRTSSVEHTATDQDAGMDRRAARSLLAARTVCLHSAALDTSLTLRSKLEPHSRLRLPCPQVLHRLS